MSDTAMTSLPIERRVVLVADDEDGILHIVARVVVRLGLEPLLVHDGAAAVEIATTCHHLLACALLDVQMPLMNGVDAAHAIQQAFPGIPLVLMSGAIPQPLVARVTQLRAARFLHKPFTLVELRDTLVSAAGQVQTSTVAVEAQKRAADSG
jgi:CheY-like chemotaxis protein